MSRLSQRTRRVRSAARPLAWPVLVCTLVCALTPRPAFADPAVTGQGAPQPTAAATAGATSGNSNLTIPDGGSTPVPSAPLPAASATAPGAAPPTVTGPFASDILAKYANEELIGQQLTQAGIDLAAAQSTTKTTYDAWQQQLANAKDLQSKADTAAAKAYKDAASLGPLGAFATDVHQLGLLAPGLGDGSRGGPEGSETATQDAAQARAQASIDEQAYDAALAHEQDLAGKQATLQASHDQLTTELTNLNTQNSAALATAEAQQALVDQGLAAKYLNGARIGNLAPNPKALVALGYALARINNPNITYLWATQGPTTYDCSGLAWAAYKSAGYAWPRLTAADQFNQTRSQQVASDQLLPGDLLFFSYSHTDWTQIYHVAIYAGDGQMVEAAYNHQPLDKATVHWATFFAATRVYPGVPPVTPTMPPPATTPLPTTPPPSSTTQPPSSTTAPESPSPSPQSPVPTGPPSGDPGTPTDPAPTAPTPTDPAPTAPTPTDPAPTGTTPTDTPTGSAPSNDANATASQSATTDPSAASDPSAGA